MDDVITDDEVLYRCVFRGVDKYYSIGEFGAKVSSQAFADRGMAPSVDRAKLCNCNPKWTQKNPDDAVVSLITGDIRMIDNIVQRDDKGKEILAYKIDVCPRATDSNPSHAQIEPSPEYKNKAPFRKVIERLAFLANERLDKQGWEIEPYELRS
ncbi:hypothetical protein H6G93_25035 [Nostoc sp. FACHB-973]|nr:hypothetical protein [Nostoc sp. FACHB-973]MBX9254752.1 hypothetical protein [Desmonostoc muscorum CCALA 125]